MEAKFNKLKTFLTVVTNNNNPNDICEVSGPQIGFKVFINEQNKELRVKVIGARQLPTDYGNVKPLGYLVKVRVFPEREKFETKTMKESWPIFNEEFVFTLPSNMKNIESYLKGKFVSLTAYAVLEQEEELKIKQNKGILKRLMSFTENDVDVQVRKNSKQRKNSYRRRSSRCSMGSRRTIGAATYDLCKGVFSQKLPNNLSVTPDVWRPIKEISSGMILESREGKKGSVEVTLTYGISEDGTNDVVEVSVTKFRCSMQTMQEHEKLGGQMYIKIKAFECDDVIQKMKSDRFDPTISLKIEENTATLRATVNKYRIKQVKVLIRLVNRSILGKKTLLGNIEIDSDSEIWKKIVETPSHPVTKMIPFE